MQQSIRALSGVLKKGRHALFVDYPETEGPVSRAAVTEQKLAPFIREIDAEDVINWRTERIGGKNVLTLVVIEETYGEPSDFGANTGCQYRVLRLTAGVYSVELFRKQEGTNNWVVVKTVMPQKASGKFWEYIPFFFIGSQNNDAAPDPAPMFDLAQINVAHFRNSADYEDAAYLMGQPQMTLAGLDEQWVKLLEDRGLYFGSRSVLPLPAGGSAQILQAQPNTMVKEAMEQKEKQAVSLGARLVEQGGAVKTATQSAGELNVQHSVLSLCAGNVSEAYLMALESMLEYSGQAGAKVVFEINKEFVELKLDAQMLTALIAAWQSGKFPEADLWANLKSYGIIDPAKTDEQIKDEIEAAAPSGPSLDSAPLAEE
jgi:hypothetical protein